MKENNSAKTLTPEEQRNILHGSYCHRYGILFRLHLLAGLKTNELLGLQWDDVDFYGRQLCVRHVLAAGSDGLGIRFSRFPRYVPLPLHIFKELMDWREEMAVPAKSVIPHHRQCNSVAASITGYQIDPTILEYFYQQILDFCGITGLTFSDIQASFSAGAFALDTMQNKSKEGQEYCSADNASAEENSDQVSVTYPVVVRRLANEFTQLYVPNFPDETISGPILTDGLIILREKLEDRLRGCDHPPAPVPVSEIPCKLGECILQLTLKL